MRYNRSSSKSSLFLIELLIIIAFFSVASVVCVRLFTQSHAISLQSRDLNRAVTVAQSAAESFKAAEGQPEEIARLLGGRMERSGAVVVYYDENWQLADAPEDRGYLLRIHTQIDGRLSVADIEVAEGAEDGRQVYTLQTKHLMDD